MLITEEYRKQNAHLHATSDFGITAPKWFDVIVPLARQYQIMSMLDYGCGKGLLKKALGEVVVEYDPAIEGKDAIPAPAGMVCCIDVLEHIEPELLDNVLADLRRCTVKVGFFTISMRPAKRILPDGRNAHLIQESYTWWLAKLTPLFTVRSFNNRGSELVVVVE